MKQNSSNSKSKKTLNLFLVIFLIAGMLSISFSWANFYQFKKNADNYKLSNSQLIAEDVKVKYESTNGFIKAMEPFITKTMEDTLTSIEQDIHSSDEELNNQALKNLKSEYNVTNIYIINEDGNIEFSTNEKEIGFKAEELYPNKEAEWDIVFNQIKENGDIYISQFARSKFEPYRFHKWGYNGIGYIEGMGVVVLEIGIQVTDIENEDVKMLVDQVVNLNEENEKVVKIDLINSSPDEQKIEVEEEQYFLKNNNIVTTIEVLNLDNEYSTAKVTTEFKNIDKSIEKAFQNSLLWTLFTCLFTFFISILFYYRFSIPNDKEIINEIIKRSIEELDEIKNKK